MRVLVCADAELENAVNTTSNGMKTEPIRRSKDRTISLLKMKKPAKVANNLPGFK
jgi:hypothetical protein